MESWSILHIDKGSDELKKVIALITGGNIPGKPIKESGKDEQKH